jgi:DNA-binding NarL/FixJ family response regulator
VQRLHLVNGFMRNGYEEITVLLGEAQQICLAGLGKLLASDFRIVGTERDGSALLRAAVESRPDVIVTDILLRFLDAGDAVRQIKEQCPATNIVILTDRRDAWSARQSLEAGGSAYILKDDTPGELFSAIRAAARGQSGIVSPLLGDPGDPSEDQKVGILTPRQQQVLRLLAEGRTQKEIASIIDVSARTVEFHKYELMRRLAVRSSAELMAVAARHGLIDIDESAVDFLHWKTDDGM